MLDAQLTKKCGSYIMLRANKIDLHWTGDGTSCKNQRYLITRAVKIV